MVNWPGDPAVRIRRIKEIRKGDDCDVSMLTMGSHTGTHMDAPLHFIRGAKAIDEMPLDAVVGPARVIEIRDRESVKVSELRRNRIARGERVLLKTWNSSRCWKKKGFVKDFVYISLEAACELAKIKVRSVGIDYLSVGGFYADGVKIHQTLLGAGIWIIEGMDLSKVRPGRVDLVCLPLRMFRGDGSPARAILRPK